MLKNNLWIFAIVIFISALAIKNHDFDSKFGRIIHSDAKGYYAYLPAIFIYQDFRYEFIDVIEIKYYPEDLSQYKNFRMEQPNGTVVNKCFPGTALFYLPFFALAALASWLAGFPVDGYSPLFQWSIVFAHVFYLAFALVFLNKAMKIKGVSPSRRVISALLVVFATNIYHYVVYDFTVAHVFGFFGASVMIYLLASYEKTKQWSYIGWLFPLLALLVITRPTNALLIFAIPLFLSFTDTKSILNPKTLFKPSHLSYIILTLAVVFIAPLLWKLQTGNWLVYSYGNEKIDLFKPHFFEFLFSYTQGWWLWTPFMLFAFIFGTIYFFKKQFFRGVLFSIGVLSVAYIFSSWWSWTFGFSYGQRPMIDFYPILIIGFAGFIEFRKYTWTLLLFIPFIGLNLLKSYQMNANILLGGRTTKEMYWENFFLTQRKPLVANKMSHWKQVKKLTLNTTQIIDFQNVFSKSLQFNEVQKGDKFIVEAIIGAKNSASNATIVLSNDDGSVYLQHYINHELYSNLRKMSVLFEFDSDKSSEVISYIMNPESNERVTITSFEVTHYRPSKK